MNYIIIIIPIVMIIIIILIFIDKFLKNEDTLSKEGDLIVNFLLEVV